MGTVFGVEDAADVGGDFLLEVFGGNVGLGILLEMELATLPRAGVEGGVQGGTESGVGVGGDAFRDADAALLEAGEEESRQWTSASEKEQETPGAMTRLGAVIAAHADNFRSC